VIVSNVTEAGFRLDEREPLLPANSLSAPRSFPAKLADLLFTRFSRLPDGPSLWIIPTELVSDNGPRLAAMVDQMAGQFPDAASFRSWMARRVHFASSLVDRITTGMPAPDLRAELDERLGYRDALLTVTEPHSLWAIEADPSSLHSVFPIDAASAGMVVFAPDIAGYRDRKLRMLNGAHTALAPLALAAGVRTVREAIEHAQLGPLLRRILFDEIVPSMSLPLGEAAGYASSVMDRFRNPWLEHEWRVIATNQTAKFRSRVVPSIAGFTRTFRTAPTGLVQALAASLDFARRAERADGAGWWGGAASPIVDIDRDLVARHWRQVDPDGTRRPLPAVTLARFATSVLGDAEIWGMDLGMQPGLIDAVTRALVTIQQ
jgi:tagaturonate reductase